MGLYPMCTGIDEEESSEDKTVVSVEKIEIFPSSWSICCSSSSILSFMGGWMSAFTTPLISFPFCTVIEDRIGDNHNLQM